MRPPRLSIWLAQHRRSISESLIGLLQMPLPTLMTVAVIGISLALPAALYVLIDNLRMTVGNWDQTAAISLFLDPAIDDADAAALAERLRQRPELARIDLISSDQAFDEFRRLGGFEGALDALDDNPLPAVLALYPGPSYSDPQALESLRLELIELPETDFARMDMLWLERLQAILQLAEQRGRAADCRQHHPSGDPQSPH